MLICSISQHVGEALVTGPLECKPRAKASEALQQVSEDDFLLTGEGGGLKHCWNVSRLRSKYTTKIGNINGHVDPVRVNTVYTDPTG